MRAAVAFLLLLAPPPLFGHQAAPRFLYIYRDSLKAGVDSVYRIIEDEGAQICTDFRCPNPYLALESLSGPHEAWWVNAFASDADTARVAHAYATNRPLAEALGAIAKRKQTLIGTPVQGFAVARPDLSRGAAWSVAGARFMVVRITRSRRYHTCTPNRRHRRPAMNVMRLTTVMPLHRAENATLRRAR